MDSPESARGFLKREVCGSNVKSDRVGDEEGEGNDKHKSSRSRKSGNMEEIDGLDGSGRSKSSGDKSETRKRSSCSSRADSDDNDYDSRKDSRFKKLKKRQEESSLEKLSSLYRDRDLDKQDGGDNEMGSRGHSRADESERRITSKRLEYDSSQNRSRSNEEKLHDELGSMDKVSEKRESSREKVHESSEQVRSSRRKWDEADTIRKTDDDYCEKGDVESGIASDSKYESSRERSASSRNELGEGKSRGPDSSDKAVKSNSKEERRADFERAKNKGKLESLEVSLKDRLERDRNYKLRHQRSATSDDESWDKPLNVDEDGNMHGKDKTSREVGHTNRSRTPERSGRRHQDSENSYIDYERSSSFQRKEFEKDAYKDDKNKDRESSKESWRRRQLSNTDKESKNSDIVFDRNREWELPRHGLETIDNERPHGRSGGRKDGSRGEAVKTSSNFGISNDDYDVIEIQTKPIDYGKAESESNFYRKTEVNQQYDTKSGASDKQWSYLHEDKARKGDLYGAGAPSEELKERYTDVDYDIQGGRGRSQKGSVVGRSSGGQSSSSGGSQSQHGNRESGSYNRAGPHGVKWNRVGRGGRVRLTRTDNQQVGMPLPMMGSPFGPLGMPPPGPMQSLASGMSPAPGPPISPGVFIPPFSPPVWPGARGVDMNILAVPPGLSPMPPGGPRFPANLGNPPNPAMYYNQSGPSRGVSPGISVPGFNPTGQMARGSSSDKSPGGWVPPKSNGTPSKAPSRGEQNDYSQNFVDSGMRPQNFIRELELTNVVEDYPKLRELIQKKDEIVAKSASPPMYFKCDLKEFELSPEFFGTKFDVILVDPPWEEYVHRAPGVADHMEYWTFKEIMNLKIEAIGDTPSFIFLWVGDGVGLEQGRQCLKKWGFRRCEDICWVKTNKNNATPGLRHDSHTLFQHSKEHCLMGIKGTVRRSTDGHIIHANIDTDVIIAEEPPYGSTQKPEDMYRIIEHFSLGRRRLELFGEDHNIRAGWVTAGKGLSSSNFNAEAYTKNFADKEGKVWQGGGGRNPPTEAPHLVVTTPEIESLRPKSPMKNQQQQQQQPVSISLTSNSSNRRAAGNSPQNPTALGLSQEGTPWGSPLDGFKGREGSSLVPSDDNKAFDMYGYNGPPVYLDFESYRRICCSITLRLIKFMYPDTFRPH